MKNHYVWRLAFAAYLIGLAVVGFWPTPVDKPIQGTIASVLRHLQGLGLPGWFDYHFVEASANLAMFIPFGILIAMVLPHRAWWWLAGLALLASSCMELGQLLFVTNRFPSPVDVVTNTLGAVIGIIAARVTALSKSMKASESSS